MKDTMHPYKGEFSPVNHLSKSHIKSSTAKNQTGDYYQEGDVIDKKFKVICKLGQGGYSQVYKIRVIDDNNTLPGGGEDRHTTTTKSMSSKSVMELGEHYAIKIEKVNVITHRLKSEAAILQKLEGKPNFTILYGFGFNGYSSFMVQSLCGMDLHELAKSRDYHGLNTKFSCQLLLQMISAVKQFHEIGYLHRDIKPVNFSSHKLFSNIHPSQTL